MDPTAQRWVSRLLTGLILCLVVLLLGMTGAQLSSPAVAQSRDRLRVATKPIAPFVIKEGDEWQGFSIDLWGEIARRLGVDFAWVEVTTVGEQLAAVSQREVDLAIAGISMTAERERQVDFSHPYFDSGLQILSREDTSPSLWHNVRRFFTPALLILIAAGVAFAVLMGHVIWLTERRHNPDFPSGYFRGIVEGVWWLYLVFATGEYRDTQHSNLVKRSLTIAWWLVGVALIAQLTGTIASSLTVQQLTSSVNGPEDLPGKRIATVEGSTAAQYLKGRGLSYVGTQGIDDSYRLLLDGEVQAVVYDAPVLQYYAAKQARGQLQVVGPIFKPEKYGIALPPASPLREQINEALLAIYQDGTYEALYQKWFGSPP